MPVTRSQTRFPQEGIGRVCMAASAVTDFSLHGIFDVNNELNAC